MTALHDAIDKLDAMRSIPHTWFDLRIIASSAKDGELAWSLYCKLVDGRDVRYVSTDLLEVVSYLETHLGHQGLTAPVEPPRRKLRLKR